MIRERNSSPYDPPHPRSVDRKFRVGMIPATVVGFTGCIAVLFGLLVVQNVIRDAMHGYDSRYIVLASILPALLFGFGAICFLASLELTRGRWRAALKTMALLLPIVLALIAFIRSLG